MNIHKKSNKFVALFSALCIIFISVFTITSGAAEYKTGKYVTYEAMNFRTGPSTNDAILFVIPEYTTVDVTEISGSFGKLTYDGVTGWMNLDYSTYIADIDKEHNGDWLIADLSQWNGSISWNSLRDEGIEGVILRIGGRGYGSAKSIYKDSAFSSYYKKAKAAGLHVGVYFFSYALSAAAAKEEAEYTLELLEENACELDLPVFIDIEDADYDNQHYRAGRSVCTTVVDTFCSVIEQAGLYAGIYTGKWFAEELINPSVFENRAVWIAHYNVSECGYKDYPVDIWQYTATGLLDSVSGYVDLNLCHVDFPAMIRGGKTDPQPSDPEPSAFGEHVPAAEWTVLQEASCTNTGLRVKTCTDCGETLLQEVLPQTAHEESETMLLLLSYFHKPGDVLTAEEIVRLHAESDPNYELLYLPTYQLTGGTKLTYCTGCRKIMSAEYSVPLCTHDAPQTTKTAPTCTEDGYELTTCSVCGNNIKGKLLPAKKHTAGEKISIYATCTSGGFIYSYCTVCGEELTRQLLPPKEHQLTLREVITQPTLTSGGEAIYECSVCGAQEHIFPGPLLLGDVTDDGEVTAEDARLTLRISVLLEEPTAAASIAGDTDNDGVITAADARNILRVAVGLTTVETLYKTYCGAPAQAAA